ncbi:MAG TPA: cation:proton antiporter [Actinomycetota bacterium]|nr:cation:proton antiporter [Actinomycetota bacterium]
MQNYEIALLVVGAAALAVAWLPRVLKYRVISFPIILVVFGAVIFALPLGLPRMDPIRYGEVAERLTEFGVIVALTGAGLKLDRRIGLKRWKTTWLLLGVTMPLTIAAVAFLGWGVLGFAPATALLFGAALAPTDPVLASDVQVGAPGSGETDEVRFALTSEAGLNDGLAFPFTNAAIAMAVTSGAGWFGEWLLVDLVYKIVAGVVIGVVAGRFLALLLFRVGDHHTKLAHSREGLVAVAVTLISYALTELAHGYGFIAVFVAALVIRDIERDHEYHKELTRFADQLERLASAVILLLFGGALVQGLLAPIDLPMVLVAAAILLLVRPLSGLIGIGRLKMETVEKPAIAFLGIRGIGSFYYLAYALNHASFSNAEELWAAVSVVVGASILIHGITAKPAIAKVAEEAEEKGG